jgi:hypothetical protein
MEALAALFERYLCFLEVRSHYSTGLFSSPSVLLFLGVQIGTEGVTDTAYGDALFF